MKYVILILTLLLSANLPACEFDQLKFEHNFATGRLDDCQQLGDNQYLLILKPENSPINNSPWYAFKVIGKQSMSIDVVMQVQGGDHRYPPKVSRNGRDWQLQQHQLQGDKLQFSLAIDQQATWISAQESLTSEAYYHWGRKLAKRDNVDHEVIGWSVQKRPLYKIETKDQGNEWLVVLGRQHPPEITGALAIFPFTDTLLADTPLAQQFRQRFNILVIPNVNPDGVYLGNWRHNANGADLNRDWGKFKQPEVASIHNYLAKLVAQGQKLSMAVDFHSTKRDIFYTMPLDPQRPNPGLVTDWLSDLDKLYNDFEVIQKPGHNPDSGVFKQYFSDSYNAHAITYEMGDNSDRTFIDDFAKNAARSLMKNLLATKAGEANEQL